MNNIINIQLHRSWQKTISHLQNGKSFIQFEKLHEEQILSFKNFDEYVDCNELELAFNELYFVAEESNLPIQFWRELLAAAQEMKLESSIIKCEKHLTEFDQK